MRIALITLALTALVFIGSIIYSLAWKENLIRFPTNTQTSTSSDSALLLEIYKNQIRDQEAKKMEDKKNDDRIATEGTLPSQISITNTWTVKVPLPLSGKFLAKVMPALEFSLIQNTGIYDLLIFDKSVEYSTYLDAKQGVKALALSIKYDTFLKNMKALSPEVYTTNETKTFPFRSFYVNPAKADTLIRLVVEIESQSIVIEIPKTKFPTFKALLLKK